MTLATVTFWGRGLNTYGIPNTLYTYLISVSANQILGYKDKIVKIVPISEGAPKPTREYPFIVKNSDEQTAIFEAIGVLEEMDCLKGLKSHKSYVDLEKKSYSVGNFSEVL